MEDDWVSEGEREGFSLFWTACAPRYFNVVREVRARAGRETSVGVIDNDEQGAVARDAEQFRRMHRAAEGDFAPYQQSMVELGARWARENVDLASWYFSTRLFREKMLTILVSSYASRPEQLEAGINALSSFLERSTQIITREYLRERERALEAQRQHTDEALLRFRRLSESGIIGIFICDIWGNAKEANDAFLNMVGYSREELLTGTTWIEMTPPEWEPLDRDAVEQLKATGRSRVWEKEYFRKDGSRVPILVGVAMLNEVDCVAFILDITERKRLEDLRARSQELELQNQRILEASRLKSEFLANMSHELRKPLNSIIGFADLLYDREVTSESPEYQDFVGDILKSGRHLLQLINDVLDLSKVESGKMEFRPEPTELTKLIGEVCAVLRTLAAEKRIQLDCNIERELLEVTLDPARLKQVLYNYVSNALKFTPPEGHVEIRARRHEMPGFFRLEVIDNGIGISETDATRLFVEFQQLDAGMAKKHAGTGLGLALTKRIVEAQGGSVGVESVFGTGSTFFAVLPQHLECAFPKDASSFVPVNRMAEPSVLVVDDDERDRNFIVKILDRAGYGVESAATGVDAVERCARKTFAAITLDLLLPDLTGLEVLHRVRSRGLNMDTPVVIVSVAAEQGVVGGFPVHDYLRKPLHGGELLASLGRAGVVPETAGTILVVDDDPSSLKLMDVTLRRLSFHVVCCSDGATALAAVELQRPLAVILDLLMPHVDGFEFLARFRSWPGNRNVPVIVWTVKDLSPGDRRRLDDLAQGVFAKGSGKPLELLEELKSLLATTRRSSVEV
jgi:PAS domain S-box-containing protein